MARTVTITINYGGASFTQRVRDLVEAIFASCFDSLEEDQVVFQWSPGLLPNGSLGKDKTFNPTYVNFNLRDTLSATGDNGSHGDYSVNINGPNIASDAMSPGVNGDVGVATANTVAHEMGLHGIAGDMGHGRSDGGTHSVDRDALSAGLCHGPAQWTTAVCQGMTPHG